MQRIAGYTVSGRPLVRWLEFHTRRFKASRATVWLALSWNLLQWLEGLVALGFACHFGLGLFMPALTFSRKAFLNGSHDY